MGLIDVPEAGTKQALFRGVTPAALEVHREVRILEGHYPNPGEVIVGKLAHHSLEVLPNALTPGGILRFEGQEFRIAGVFEAPGTVMESEVWFDRTDLMTAIQRDSLSCVVVRLDSLDGFKDADLFCKATTRSRACGP